MRRGWPNWDMSRESTGYCLVIYTPKSTYYSIGIYTVESTGYSLVIYTPECTVHAMIPLVIILDATCNYTTEPFLKC